MKLGLFVIFLLGMLSACTSPGDVGGDETRVLRIGVMYGSGTDMFEHYRTQYTDIFDYTHPEVEIEFVSAIDYSKQQYLPYEQNREEPDPVEEMIKLLEGSNPPDLLLLDYSQLARLTEENLLQPLEPMMTKHEFSLEGFVPGVIDGLKAAGNNQLYGLAPTFTSSALLYNSDIFDEQSVERPHDGMEWQEMFDLARRVSHGEGEERVYGFSFSRYMYDELFYTLVNYYTSPLDLRMVSDDGKELLVDSEQWKSVLTDIVSLYEQEIMPARPDYSQPMPRVEGPFSHDAFLSGRAAMTIVHSSQLAEIINVNNNADQYEGYEPINWDIVSLPTHPEAPGIGAAINLDPVMAINARAQNPDDAWELIQFLNSEDWAKLRSRSTYMLMTREAFNEPQMGADYNIAAFYTLRPPISNATDIYRIMPNYWQIQNLGQQKLDQVLRDELSIEQMLSEWKTEGEMMIQEFKENGGGEVIMY